ncbi:MAG: TetR/AcrR family transcriptional regulator [Spirochaetes bacterium]|nr:TetR/AcrR family transcriptional regulator [Spirochaetota bacterium]
MARKNVQEERRNQILKALQRCLLSKPFNETSIKDIAKAAKVNHGVLHYYFKSKEDILLNFIDYIISSYRGMYQEWAAGQDMEGMSHQELLRRSLIFMNERITLNRDLSRIFVEIGEIASYHRKVRTKLRQAYMTWIDTFAGVARKAGLSEGESGRFSRALIAYYEGMSLFSVIMDREEFDAEGILSWFQDQVMAAMVR